MLRSIFGRVKAPANTYPPFALQQAQAEQWSLPSMSMPAAQAELYQRLSWVQIAVGIIARSVATAGIQVKRMVGDAQEAIVNHPFEILLQHPNPHMSRAQLLEATSAYKRLTGNAYWWLNRRSQNAPPDEVWLIPSQQITPIPDGRLYLAGYEYDAGTGQKLMLPVDAICHFRSFNPLSQFVGLSPIEALATVAIGDMAMQRWNTAYFDKNNAKLPGALTFAQMIPDAQWEKIQSEFKRQYGGTERNLLMLRGVGDSAVSWITMAANQKDMEFLAGRQASKEEIFMMLGVPPGMMDKNATEANAVASKAVFSELTLWPDLVSMAETITNAILPAYGENLILAFDDPRKTDRALELQEQAEYARTHTIDEVRAKFYEDDPIGDERGNLLVAEIAQGGIPGVDVPEKPAPVIMPPGAQAETEPGADAEEPDEAESEDEPPAQEREADLPRGKALLDDLHAWRRKCKAQGRLAEFESAVISPGLRARIVADASTQADTAHIKAVFDGIIAEVKAVRVIPDGARDPLPPLPYEVEFTETDFERMSNLWDELMPEYAGMLDAENVNRVPNDA